MAKKNGKTPHVAPAHENVADMVERSCLEAAHEKNVSTAQRKAFTHLGTAVAEGLRHNGTWFDSFKRAIEHRKRKGN